MELEKSWASVMHQDHTDFSRRRKDRNCSISQQRRQRFRPMWRVREHMAFLIRNLQFYIQVIDVMHVVKVLGIVSQKKKKEKKKRKSTIGTASDIITRL